MKYARLILAACAIGGLAACSDDGATNAVPTPVATASPTPETAAEPTPTTAPDPTPTEEATATPVAGSAIEQELAERVRGYFAARAAANAAPAPNPDDPTLAEFATGDELAAVVQSTAKRRDDGLAIRPGDAELAEINVGFVEVDEPVARVAACAVDDGVIFNVATGDVVDDVVVTNNYSIDLEQSEGIWRVANIERIQQWEGVGGCALAAGDYPY